MNIDDEGGADGREQTGLEESIRLNEVRQQVTYEYQGCIEIFVVFLDVVRIALGRLPLVHRVEGNARIFCIDGLEESSENI